MEYREIRIAVSEYGKATVVRQWGGMQYENNNTAVCFDIGAIDSSDTSFRIDFDSPEAGYDPGEVIELDGNIISRRIPYKFTRYGGEMQATAVGTRVGGSIAYSVPVKIYFTEVDRHEETEDAIPLNVSELEMSVLEAAERAEYADINSRQSAEEAAMSADAAKEAAERAEEAANSAGGITQEQLDAKQDKFADVRLTTEPNGTVASAYIDIYGKNDSYITAQGYLDIKAGSYLGLISKNAPVSVNGVLVWPTNDGTYRAYIENLYVPPTAEDHYAVNKGYVDNLVGDIESALDSVIALQNSLIGGDA